MSDRRRPCECRLLYANAVHAHVQRPILILPYGPIQPQITQQVTCLMQFPTNSLVSHCINTLRHILVTPNKTWPDRECVHIPQC